MNPETVQHGTEDGKTGGASLPPEENPNHANAMVNVLMREFGWTYSRANRYVAVAVQSFEVFGEVAARHPNVNTWLLKELHQITAKCTATELDTAFNAVKEAYAVADAMTQPALVRLENNETPETLRHAIGKLRLEAVCNAELTGVLERRRVELVK